MLHTGRRSHDEWIEGGKVFRRCGSIIRQVRIAGPEDHVREALRALDDAERGGIEVAEARAVLTALLPESPSGSRPRLAA